MTGWKKGKIYHLKFADHSLEHRGSKKDNDVMILNVVGRLKSARGKQVILETWWLDNNGLDDNHETAKVLKSVIIKRRILKD